ncbi:MAG TPA: hypothetical protein VEH47_08260 [Candidatus Acidoferrales bacterium]|nr:hypothetical protein [Candidatus Acidoferrales bacterium]
MTRTSTCTPRLSEAMSKEKARTTADELGAYASVLKSVQWLT